MTETDAITLKLSDYAHVLVDRYGSITLTVDYGTECRYMTLHSDEARALRTVLNCNFFTKDESNG
jgi:hypothetical protein